MTDPFAPPGAAWQQVSPALARLRRLLVAVATALLLLADVVAAAVGLQSWGACLLVALPVLLVAAGLWWWAGSNARRWGYAERAEDLYVRHGALFRRLVAVPYGRMQYVDVHAGPLERAFGIAGVRLHTASPGTSAHIPGLPVEEAARLRDRLTALGESQAAGL